MRILERLIPGWGRREVVFRAYVIHERDSEFEWKPKLEDLCRNYDARLRSYIIEIIHESARLNMLVSHLLSENREISDSLISKIDEIEYMLQFGLHFTNRVFDIRISVDRESLGGDEASEGVIGKLREEAVRILEDSDPWYFSLE